MEQGGEQQGGERGGERAGRQTGVVEQLVGKAELDLAQGKALGGEGGVSSGVEGVLEEALRGSWAA